MRPILLVWACSFLLADPCFGQVQSGPKPGAKIEPLKVSVVEGDKAGESIDLAAEQKDKATIYAFVQADKWDRPVARYLKTIDDGLAKSHPEVKMFAVWLTDDLEKSKAYLPKAQQSLKFSQTSLAVYSGDKSGPPEWLINPSAHITVIVAKEGKVAANFAFRSVNETDSPDVLKAIDK